MENTNLNEEILSLEKKFWLAIKENDLNTMMELTSFPCIVSGSSGVGVIDQEMFKGMMDCPNYTLNSFEIYDAEVRQVANDVAVIAYKVHEEITVDEKSLTVDATDASTWVRTNGKWLCAAHSESLAGDPYGRDKKAA
jgi:hypothetical protein